MFWKVDRLGLTWQIIYNLRSVTPLNYNIFFYRWRLVEGQSIDFKNLNLRDNVAQLSVFEVLVLDHSLMVFLFTMFLMVENWKDSI